MPNYLKKVWYNHKKVFNVLYYEGYKNTMDKNILYELIRSNASNMPEGMKVGDDTRLIEDMGYDSVDLMQLIVDIEDEFGISLMDDDMIAEKLNTPSELMEVIAKYRN